MKKFLLLLTFCILFIGAFSAPFKFLPHKITQPDGKVIECYLSGDEFFNWIHDENGFSIIKGSDGYYYYAKKEKEKITASSYRVNSVNPEKITELKKWTIISKDEYIKKRDFYNIPSKNEISNAPHAGQFNNIVIYIRFSGESEITTPRQEYDDNLNSETSNSLKSYFTEVSYNQLTINSTHYPDCANPTTANASYEDSHSRSYFQPYDVSTNPDGYTDDNSIDREHQLLVDAVTWVNNNNPIDAALNLDGDNDGKVDNVCFMIQGNSGEWAELLWAHRWSLFSKTVEINGKRVYDYTFQPENQVDVSVLCHEMFHALGAPDLYHYEESTLSPVSSWDLMESGSGHMGAYMKYKYADKKWISEIPEITAAGTYTLNPLTSSTNNCYMIASPNSTTEFFVLEYRKKEGEFESNLLGEGLLVYRINSNFDGNASYDGTTIFDEVYIYRPNGTTTLNGSASTANFSSNVSRTEINDITNPNSFLTDGSVGGLNIFNITSAGSTISFEVKIGAVDDPLNFSAVIASSNQINLSWNLNADNNDVVLAYSLDGTFGTPEDGVSYNTGNSIPGGGEVLYSGNNISYNHLSLTSGQEYYYQIWSVDTEEAYSIGKNITTYIPCEEALLPFTEDFSEELLPSCWLNKDNIGTGQVWEFNNTASLGFGSTSGANGIAILNSDSYGDGGSQNTDLVCALLDLSIYNSVKLKFEHYFEEFSGSYAELIYSIDAGQTWNSIQTWSSTEGSFETPTVFNMDISSEVAGESEVLIAWKYVGSWGYYWVIDDVEITGVSSGEPVVVTKDADGIMIDLASLHGNINANGNTITEIQFEYGTESGNYSNTINATPSTASGSLNTNVAVEIPSLTGNTEYFYRVKCKDGADILTGEEKSFTTDARPTVIITSDEEDYVNIDPFQVQLTFNEPIISISETDIAITNGTVTGISGTSSTIYTLYIAPDSDGEVTLQIAENTIEDLSGNGNIASSVFTIIYDSSAPEIVISSSESVSTEVNPIPVIFTFNEDVSDFNISDITVTNGTAANFITTSASIYNAEIIPLNQGDITVKIIADLVSDIAGNKNIVSNGWSINYSLPLGIEEFIAAGIKLYPNPTNGLITVEYNNSIEAGSVKIFNYLGKLIYTKILNNDKQQSIDLTNQAKGVYIIQFTLGKKQISTQLIIQ
ncbi:MAG: M6 family metalloprotease domain-containing protein [Bacteroidales bacterium]|nr:M6 family metalloprotease domain-containing protein [Bacteroidales bacterium]